MSWLLHSTTTTAWRIRARQIRAVPSSRRSQGGIQAVPQPLSPTPRPAPRASLEGFRGAEPGSLLPARTGSSPGLPLRPQGRGTGARDAPLLVQVITFPTQIHGGVRRGEGLASPAPPAPETGKPAPRTPRHLAHAQMRVPEAKSPPRLPTNFASCLSPTAQGTEPGSCHWKSHGKNRETSPGVCTGPEGTGKMELTGTSWFGGWCEGAGEGARTHAHTQTRAHTLVHRRARTRGAGAHAEHAGDPRGCSPPVGTALAGWGGGREAVTGATSAAVAFPERRGSSSAAGQSRAELRAAGSAATGRGVCAATLSPGPLGGGGGPRWVGTRGTGGRCGEAAPGAHVCPARGEERGRSPRTRPRAPPLPASREAAPRGGRPGAVTRPGTQPGSPECQRGRARHTHAQHTSRTQTRIGTHTDTTRSANAHGPHACTDPHTDSTRADTGTHADTCRHYMCTRTHATHAGMHIDFPTDTHAWTRTDTQKIYHTHTDTRYTKADT